jgi:lipoate---protein ligase
MVVISLVFNHTPRPGPQAVFAQAGRTAMAMLSASGISGIALRGTSDLAIGERKIMGSAIYQGGSQLFYHAVLNVAQDPAILDRYLTHPRREPAYRQGRSHSDFVTSLLHEGYDRPLPDLIDLLATAFRGFDRGLSGNPGQGKGGGFPIFLKNKKKEIAEPFFFG